MRLSRSYPEIVGLEILEEFYKKNQAALFVANHCSWMDIPFLGATVGWRNYKLVSKKELTQIPILGTAITLGGNITVDRKDRRSQIKTLKDGIAYLKVSVHYRWTNSRMSACRNFAKIPIDLITAPFRKTSTYVLSPKVPVLALVDSSRLRTDPSKWRIRLEPQ